MGSKGSFFPLDVRNPKKDEKKRVKPSDVYRAVHFVQANIFSDSLQADLYSVRRLLQIKLYPTVFELFFDKTASFKGAFRNCVAN